MASPPSAPRLDRTPDTSFNTAALLDTPHLRQVLDILNPEGEETRLVGGAVRNALLGLPPGDIDLATTMLPAEVTRRAKAARLRVIPTGISHGTVTILSGGTPFEVTTLREDVETDGRHAVVRFGRDFTLDAARRDFTMNALSLGPDGRVFDTVGGVDDLARGHVRFIGDAATRIREDYLRILRFFRFHATYGLAPLDSDGLVATIDNRDGLTSLSRERVRAEFLKILLAPGALAVLGAMRESGILGFVVSGPVDLDRLGRLLVSSDDQADTTLRLAALSLDGQGRIDALREDLRLTNVETKRLEAARRALVALPDTSGPPDEATLLLLLFAHGREASLDALRLRWAASPDQDGPWPQRLSFLREAEIPNPPFVSADLMRRGLKGPALGAALAALRTSWAEAGFPTDAETVEALIGAAASRHAAS